ncbi:uncharacterized protein [Spinacia oleracea]|uniref:Transposase-associated domain-containing protein n=1 Tax=Spinacia oleracea TaxID=3562 RepID=A0ABM3RQP1_SPIOL|nr:uncharacterized protein LOC130471695 [Spinacia oleracea]
MRECDVGYMYKVVLSFGVFTCERIKNNESLNTGYTFCIFQIINQNHSSCSLQSAYLMSTLFAPFIFFPFFGDWGVTRSNQVDDIHQADFCKMTPAKFCGSKEMVPLEFRKLGLREWVVQREASSSTSNNMSRINDQNTYDDIDGLLHDTFIEVEEGLNGDQGVPSKPNEVLNGLSNTTFEDLLELLREKFPMAQLPKSYNESKNIIKDLGLDYKKIHACPNDCILYRKEYEGADVCPKCETSRWKSKNIPAKVLRHFPLKPRLQRVFMCSKTPESMVWHDKERTKDDKIRHPADAQSWKDFDETYPDFKKEPRNVRLALASDGFNPFRTMSVSHSTL